MEIVADNRLGLNDEPSSFVDALLETDEASELLERDDVQALKQQNKKAHTARDESQTFSEEYKEERQKLNQQAKKVVKGKATTHYPREIPFSIEQSQARLYIPPNSSIWRGMTKNNSWHGHYQGRSRISCSWLTHGESGAMKDIIRRLWSQQCEKMGLELSEVPFKNLWEDAQA